MTDFKDEKPKPRTPRISHQNEHFDFDLADMRVLPDYDMPAPSPLDHITDDEDAIDRVLLDANFPPNQADTTSSLFTNNDESLLPPKTPEIKTSFYVDYFDKRKKTEQTPTTPMAESEPIATPEPIVQAEPEPMVEAMQTENETVNTEPTEFVENEQSPMFNSSGMAFAVLSQFKSKQESINKQQEKLIQEFSKKIKKATAITYTATFFGIAALATAATLGLMLFKAENKLSQLESSTTALKDDFRNIKVSPDVIEEGTDPSLDQIHQKIDDVEEKLSDMAELQNKVAILEKNVSTNMARQTAILAANKTTDVPDEAPVVPDVAVKTTAIKPKAATKPTTTTKPNTVVPATIAANTITKPQTVTKPTTGNISKPSTKKDDIDKAIDVPANDINKVTSNSHAQSTTNSHAQTSTQQSSTKESSNKSWTVNLASSNHLEDAKRTAAAFQQKGINVSVNPFTVKNETRYRLQVKGFKSKEEATAFANKAKSTLKLNSVWINP